MEYNSDEDILNAHPTIQIIEQDDVPEATSSLTRSQFRVVVKEGALAAVPPRELSYFEWSIAIDPAEIDGGEEGSRDVATEDTLGAEENGEPESMDNDDEAERNSSGSSRPISTKLRRLVKSDDVKSCY
jgi:hypothetical protein